MPLSEQEQRLLDEMERNLYQNDADFVATVGGRRGKPSVRFVVLGIVLALVGIATLITGVIVQWPVVGILGFVIMFAGVLLAVAPPRALRSAPRPASSSSRPASRKTASFMDGLNDRWDRRNEERGNQ
jgi:hypothetical protein